MLIEQQLKLGYIKETVRLYYPLSSLNKMLGTNLDVADMLEHMKSFEKHVAEKTGIISVSADKDRFCFLISEKYSEKIHNKLMSESSRSDAKISFLKKLIELVSEHDVSIEMVKKLFGEFSADYAFETCKDEEFDYLAYFPGGKPDDYRYCFVDEGCHIIYHRFSREDYEEMYGAIKE